MTTKSYFTALPLGLLALPAMAPLTANMVSCLMAFLLAYRPDRPHIKMSVSKLAKLSNCSQSSAHNAIDKLVEIGFIYRYGENSFGKNTKARVYTVESQPIEPHEPTARRGYAVYGDGGKIYEKLFPDGEHSKVRHFRIWHFWLRFPAWRTLSPIARSILWHMHKHFNPTEFVFKYSVNDARKDGKCRYENAKVAMDELFTKGWIAKDDDGMFYLQAFGDGSPNGKKDGFKKWTGKAVNTEPSQNSLSKMLNSSV